MKNLDKFKIPLYSFFMVRTPYYIFLKKIKLFFAKQKNKTYFQSSKRNNEFLKLLHNGMITAKNIIDSSTIKNWVERYKINNDSFSECEGNISFPFYNKEFHHLLFNSVAKQGIDFLQLQMEDL